MSLVSHGQYGTARSWRLGLAGRLAVGIFAIHVLLLFFPPIPPDVKGSLWSYLLAIAVVVLGAMEVRSHAPGLARFWGGLRPWRRIIIGAGTAMGMLAFGLAIRSLSPELFDRWTRPEGVWEPLTVLTYLASALLIGAAARGLDIRDRRYLHFFAAGYVLLVLEEVDYLGIFGGIIGRVNGVYVGAPHDLLNLAVEGLLAPWMVALAVAVVAAALGLAYRSGHLQPARLAGTVFAWRGLWLVAFIVFIAAAQIEDTGSLYFLGEPRLEELLELVSAIFLFAFAADLAGDAVRQREPSPRDTSPTRSGARFARAGHGA